MESMKNLPPKRPDTYDDASNVDGTCDDMDVTIDLAIIVRRSSRRAEGNGRQSGILDGIKEAWINAFDTSPNRKLVASAGEVELQIPMLFEYFFTRGTVASVLSGNQLHGPDR
jgi:hypothetical protein